MKRIYCQYCGKKLVTDEFTYFCNRKCQMKATIKSIEMLTQIDRTEKLDKLLEATL